MATLLPLVRQFFEELLAGGDEVGKQIRVNNVVDNAGEVRVEAMQQVDHEAHQRWPSSSGTTR